MKKILLVDDDPDILDSLAAILSREFTVDTARNGAEALEKLDHEILPDLILLDVQMETPQEGFDLAKKLEETDTLSHIPIIIITSTDALPTSEATAHIVRKTLEKYSDNSVNVLLIKSRDGSILVDYKSKKTGRTATISVKGYHNKPVNPEKLIREINHLLN